MVITGVVTIFSFLKGVILMNENEQSEIFSDEKSEDATSALIITTRTEISDNSKTHLSNDAPPSIETLTAEIKMYFHIANQRALSKSANA